MERWYWTAKEWVNHAGRLGTVARQIIQRLELCEKVYPFQWDELEKLIKAEQQGGISAPATS